MSQAITFVNRKYFREFDNTDNPCCWQVEQVGHDIERLLVEAGIEAEEMYEDRGAAWSWCTNGITHSMQLMCVDVDKSEYRVEYFAIRPKWYFFKTDVPDEQSNFGKLIPRLRQFLGGRP
jgi:hypothetical protein